MSRHAHIATNEKPEAHFTEDAHQHDGHESLAPTGTRGTDNEKGSSRYASSEAGLAHKKGVTAAERKLLLKMGKSATTISGSRRDGHGHRAQEEEISDRKGTWLP